MGNFGSRVVYTQKKKKREREWYTFFPCSLYGGYA